MPFEDSLGAWMINNGFAVAVTCYLLWERTVKTDKFVDSIDRLTAVISQCPKK